MACVLLQREALDIPQAHARRSSERFVNGGGLPGAGSLDAGPGLGMPDQQRRFARLGGAVELYAPEDGGTVFRGSLPA